MFSICKDKDELFDQLQDVASAEDRIRDALENFVAADTITSTARTPFKVATYRSGLTCRFLETLEAVRTVFKARQLGASITLTGSAVETAASLWELAAVVKTATEVSQLAPLIDLLDTLYAAEPKTSQTRTPRSFRVARFVRHLDRQFPGFEHECQALFMADRPEWYGAGRLYSDEEIGAFGIQFKRHVSYLDDSVRRMSAVLMLTSSAYEHTDRALKWAMPNLASLDAREHAATSESSSGFGFTRWTDRPGSAANQP